MLGLDLQCGSAGFKSVVTQVTPMVEMNLGIMDKNDEYGDYLPVGLITHYSGVLESESGVIYLDSSFVKEDDGSYLAMIKLDRYSV